MRSLGTLGAVGIFFILYRQALRTPHAECEKEFHGAVMIPVPWCFSQDYITWQREFAYVITVTNQLKLK